MGIHSSHGYQVWGLLHCYRFWKLGYFQPYRFSCIGQNDILKLVVISGLPKLTLSWLELQNHYTTGGRLFDHLAKSLKSNHMEKIFISYCFRSVFCKLTYLFREADSDSCLNMLCAVCGLFTAFQNRHIGLNG